MSCTDDWGEGVQVGRRFPPPYQHSPIYQYQYKPATQNRGETERPYMAVTTSSYSRRVFRIVSGTSAVTTEVPVISSVHLGKFRDISSITPFYNFFRFTLKPSPYHTTLHNRHTGYNVK
jgi:hypothetical protein